MLKKSFKIFKEKVLIVLGLQILYLALTLLLGGFGYRFIFTRMQTLGNYGPGLNNLLTQLETQNLQEIDFNAANTQVQDVNSLITMLKLGIVFLPIFLFLIYFILEGMSWDLVSRDKINWKKIFDYKYILIFSAISIVYFFVLYLLSAIFSSNYQLNVNIFALPILSFLILYFLVISYSLLHKSRKFFVTFKKTFEIGVKKIYILLPIMFVFFVIFLILIGIYNIINGLISSLVLLYIVYFLEAIVVLIYFVYFKVFFTAFVNKY